MSRRKPDESENASLAAAYTPGEEVIYLGQPNGTYSFHARVLEVTGKRLRLGHDVPVFGRTERLVDPRAVRATTAKFALAMEKWTQDDEDCE